jgi:hypothetical protein
MDSNISAIFGSARERDKLSEIESFIPAFSDINFDSFWPKKVIAFEAGPTPLPVEEWEKEIDQKLQASTEVYESKIRAICQRCEEKIRIITGNSHFGKTTADYEKLVQGLENRMEEWEKIHFSPTAVVIPGGDNLAKLFRDIDNAWTEKRVDLMQACNECGICKKSEKKFYDTVDGLDGLAKSIQHPAKKIGGKFMPTANISCKDFYSALNASESLEEILPRFQKVLNWIKESEIFDHDTKIEICNVLYDCLSKIKKSMVGGVEMPSVVDAFWTERIGKLNRELTDSLYNSRNLKTAAEAIHIISYAPGFVGDKTISGDINKLRQEVCRINIEKYRKLIVVNIFGEIQTLLKSGISTRENLNNLFKYYNEIIKLNVEIRKNWKYLHQGEIKAFISSIKKLAFLAKVKPGRFVFGGGGRGVYIRDDYYLDEVIPFGKSRNEMTSNDKEYPKAYQISGDKISFFQIEAPSPKQAMAVLEDLFTEKSTTEDSKYKSSVGNLY